MVGLAAVFRVTAVVALAGAVTLWLLSARPEHGDDATGECHRRFLRLKPVLTAKSPQRL